MLGVSFRSSLIQIWLHIFTNLSGNGHDRYVLSRIRKELLIRLLFPFDPHIYLFYFVVFGDVRPFLEDSTYFSHEAETVLCLVL